MQLEGRAHALAGVAGQGAVQQAVAEHLLDAVGHLGGVAGVGQQTARTPGLAAGGGQIVVDELLHAAHLRAHGRDAGGHRLQHDDRLALVVAGQHEQVELVEHRAHVDGAVEDDAVFQAERRHLGQALLVVPAGVLGGPADVDDEVAHAAVAQDVDGVDEVEQALDGHDPSDVGEPARAPGARDALHLAGAGLVGVVELAHRHPVGHDDGALGRRAQLGRLLDRQRVQVGDEVGAGVAQAAHLDPPRHPRALLRLDVERAVVGFDDLQAHVAVEQGVDGVPHV